MLAISASNPTARTGRRVARGERAVAAAARVMTPGEIGEFDTRCGRDDELARVDVVKRGPDAREGVGVVGDEALVTARLPAAALGREPELFSAAAENGLSVLEEDHGLGDAAAVESRGEVAGLDPAGRQQIDHPGAVGSRHHELGVRAAAVEEPQIGERLLEAHGIGDVRLAVIGKEEHVVALEELVDSARRRKQRADRIIAAAEGGFGRVRARDVRGEVVVRQVVDEEVEAVRVTSQRPTAAP